jgi:N-acetylgalactosamine-N,N'-diacetylbacillosaminyl-diphospho-undecaprenol 4-alpha-N-acetylgalactosaminyltransferase
LLLLAKELGVGHRVHCVGWVENPYVFIAKSTIFVMASESESFANVIVESMVCGIPVISSDCGGPREILAPNTEVDFQLKKGSEYAKYGILYAVGDVKALVESIQKLLDDEKLYKHYSIAGQDRANDFSVEKIIKQYRNVLCAE